MFPNEQHGNKANPEFNWDGAARDYVTYRNIYPASFYEKMRFFGIGLKDQNILDIGTGPGIFPRAMYSHGAKFTGIDISAGQIEEAQKWSAQAQADINWIVGKADQSGLSNALFDVVTAIQSWQYFEPNSMAKEVHRLLRPGGQLVIAWMIWLTAANPIVAQTEQLIAQYQPNWGGLNQAREQLFVPEWINPLFSVETLHTYDEAIPFTRKSWSGRIRATKGIGAMLNEAQIKAFDQEHKALLKQISPASFTIKHQVIIQIFRAH